MLKRKIASMVIAVISLTLAESALSYAEDFFPLAVGDRWVYSTNTGDDLSVAIVASEKTSSGDSGYAFEINQGQEFIQKKFYVKKGSDIIAYKGTGEGRTLGDFSFEPPLVWLKQPLFKGSSWSQSVIQKNKLSGSQRDINFSISVKVAGKEAVEVPAGKFTCYKIEIIEKFYDKPDVFLNEWLADGVGMVKESIRSPGNPNSAEILMNLKEYTIK